MSGESQQLSPSEVYETYFPAVYNYVFYKLLHKQETEDLVSTIFIKVFKNLDRYDETKASVKTWIFRIADNALIDFYRRRKPQISMDDEENGLDNTLHVDFDDQYNDIVNPRRKALYAAISRLSERDRTFIYYKYFEHCTNRSIAQSLSMNESTVAAILSRARAKLKVILADQL